MKIALVYAGSDPLVHLTVRYERYVHGFRLLGHEALTVCPPGSEVGYTEPVVVAPNFATLCDPAFYKSLRCDIGIAITWLALPRVVAALRHTCSRVVSISDNDGQIGAGVHPKAELIRSVMPHSGWGMRARAAKFWLQRCLFGSWLDREKLDSASHADAITVTSPGARDHLSKFYRYHRRPDLAAKVVVAPYPVGDEFLNGDVLPADQRANRVVAIGRWDDPQKDAKLLAAGIAWAAQRLPTTEFVLIGRQGEEAFDQLCRRIPRVRYLGVRSPAEIAAFLRESRALVLSSGWESGPIVAFEALSVGATVIGPESVPACRWFVTDGPFGTTFAQRSGIALGAALVREMRAWNAGHRDPLTIAAHWRPRFDPVNVSRVLLGERGLERS